MAAYAIRLEPWTDRLSELGAQMEFEPIFDEPLSLHTSFGVGGPADVFVEPRSLEQLSAIEQFCAAELVPFFVLGNGTNMIANDKGFRGVIATLRRLDYETNASFNGDFTPAGRSLAALVEVSVTHGLSGLESLTGIPGSVGGAIYMNAGAYGKTIWDSLEDVWLMLGDGSIERCPASDFGASYRNSKIIPGEIVLGAKFRLKQVSPEQTIVREKKYRERRSASQPLSEKSAGCIFRNPEKGKAGAMIDRAGLKGLRIGGAMVSEIHANFIVNAGGAWAADILSLVRLVRDEVMRSEGIELSLEVQALGEHGLVEI
ncbi:MAG: UDP-N-acetylmuramate dehydrogenase [Candidatus Coatesbacteria bacterium]|nr:UDP-N-acetylmuramate dehydrogenase [Candidatus Coatesbacteria bacterium]